MFVCIQITEGLSEQRGVRCDLPHWGLSSVGTQRQRLHTGSVLDEAKTQPASSSGEREAPEGQ